MIIRLYYKKHKLPIVALKWLLKLIVNGSRPHIGTRFAWIIYFGLPKPRGFHVACVTFGLPVTPPPHKLLSLTLKGVYYTTS